MMKLKIRDVIFLFILVQQVISSLVPPKAFTSEQHILRAESTHSEPQRENLKCDSNIPVGAFYTLSLNVPVIGSQTFELKILSPSVAHLRIKGRILNINDTVRYHLDEDGNLEFSLSEKTKRILRRFRTSLSSVEYCNETDTPRVVVNPPISRKVCMDLKRTIDANNPFVLWFEL